ncbi:hypothetical protein [Fredinandcohnia onubensis]|uniref:hypothetical protein n=1 Tax=Fredinandcohnia onubensis TaxID=1571209 RepID=UPI000C0BB8D8|nr:hypothetical protein [Fredinandcohnia onubensis]
MELYIFALIAVFLVIPMILLLPTGLSKLGKYLVLGITFVFGLLSILLESFLSLWKTVIIIVLLLFLVSFIVEKRYGINLFKKKQPKVKQTEKVIKFEVTDQFEEVIHFNDKAPIENNEKRTNQNTNSENKNQDLGLINNDQSEEHAITLSDVDEYEYLVAELKTQTDNEKLNPQSVLMEYEQIEDVGTIETLENLPIQEDGTPSTLTVDDDNELQINDYDSEPSITDVGLEELPIQMNESAPTYIIVEDNDLQTEEYENEASVKDITLEEIAVTEVEDIYSESLYDNNLSILDELINEIEEIDNVQNNTLKKLEEENVGDKNELNNESIQSTDIEEISSLKQVEIMEENALMENNISRQTDMIIEDEKEPSDMIDEVNISNEYTETRQQLQKDVLQTMVSQLRLLQKQLPSERYEEMVIKHLHPQLSDTDCYTFISLLIEHYLREEKYEKLYNLLSDYRERFTKYPIIATEMDFLLEEYCQIGVK